MEGKKLLSSYKGGSGGRYFEGKVRRGGAAGGRRDHRL